ncbi:prolipoprotein diacylglyceryl transferase [Campylobacter sp. MIT 12-5580]|uniref:prolipoprotein diacylglyceryl transferase n=1 Tax=Campylobacter sp. MIT 12-5580 TaxID=2040651 RepID=UPI0010F829D6|nr:prolipoprotein diacylglyceryl transferase [Campylobacter sp. MIT 12-5580]TKX29292.1 prolipoprotein diacylglyceryl transferase [Campylobacter sp. MIT 12-5580]
MQFWQDIYSHFDVIAFEFFGFKVYWYSLCYIFALLFALVLAKHYVKKDKIPIGDKLLDSYFVWVELGVILGARLGYILIYDDYTLFYLTHPWQIFNPFDQNGEFVGIRGMSFHGAVLGAFIATLLFCRRFKKEYFSNLLKYLDLVALSVPLAYTFGRIGNFLNQELFGRATDVPWGIYVNGVLRHPSQLYEAFLEGFVIFLLIHFLRTKQKFQGELILVYAMSYSFMRFVCEFFREPDSNLGFIVLDLSMGQLLSLVMFGVTFLIYIYLRFNKNYFLSSFK